MSISRIIFETRSLSYPITQKILAQFSHLPQIEIENLNDHWGRSKKPYLEKRSDLQLYLGLRPSPHIKPAPDAYGISLDKEPHFYFIHAYNCIYECEYCYLQGHFQTPDLVLFVNHDDIIQSIASQIKLTPNAWFHAGEFSDSLALSSITNEWREYFELFYQYPSAQLELRTKSHNIQSILELAPAPNIHITFSLSPEKMSATYDRKTPSLEKRLGAIAKLVARGFRIGIHFDPILIEADTQIQYQQLITQLKEVLPDQQLSYLSLGVVRFTDHVWGQVKKNYPDSPLMQQTLVESFDNKWRSPRPIRTWHLGKIREQLRKSNYSDQKIYFCME
jgi:spore photoproduct lyase